MKRIQTESSGTSNKNRTVQCPECSKIMRSDTLDRHLVTHKAKNVCRYCKKDVREDQLPKHEVLCKDKVDEKHCNRSTGIHQHIENDPDCSSVAGFFNTYNLNVEGSSDYDVILNETCHAARDKLTAYLYKHPIKAQIIVTLVFYKNNVNGDKEESEKAFRSVCEPLLIGDEIDPFLLRTKETIRLEIDTYQRFGSGWIFDKHCNSKLEIARYSPLSASGTVFIPKKLRKIRSVLNIKSGDNRCFLYCILAKLYPCTGKNPDRYSKYLPFVDSVNLGNIKFPVKLSEIKWPSSFSGVSILVA